MANWKDKIIRMMYGRYGADALYGFLQVLFWLLFVVNLFARSVLLSVLTSLVLVWMLFRFFSRDREMRRKENEWFLRASKPMRSFLSLQQMRWRERKTKRFRRCPYCKTILRLPIKKGTHVAGCPQCHRDVKVHIWL